MYNVCRNVMQKYILQYTTIIVLNALSTCYMGQTGMLFFPMKQMHHF